MGTLTRHLKYEHRILALGLAAGLPGMVTSFLLLWQADYTIQARVFLAASLVLVWLIVAFLLRKCVVFPLRTVSNLLAALREGDYSLRTREARLDDALGAVAWEANALADCLWEQRLGKAEATALLRRVLAEIDIAMLGFDGDRRLQLVNDSARQLLGRTDEQLIGCCAEQLGLADCLVGETPRVLEAAFSGGTGRWELRRAVYREKGVSHQLVFLSDLTCTLHEEERRAWTQLIRTVRHEVKNSLTPVQSVAESLRALVEQRPLPEDWRQDMREGLELIAERCEALDRFIGAYSRLMYLPPLRFSALEVPALVRRVAGLETRMEVEIAGGADVRIQADRDQLEQLLINVLSNAVEASLQTHSDGDGQVSLRWWVGDGTVEVQVEDDGPGLTGDHDAFMPFYTTKERGSGIGLTLSRQIAEAHGGTLALENRRDATGCRAHLRLPLR